MSNNFFGEREKKCHYCGKEFISTSGWAYRQNDKFFCSWGCLRAAEKHRESAADRREKIIQALKDGLNVNEVATLVGVTKRAVIYWEEKLGMKKDDA